MAETLGTLWTHEGEKPTYDAASQCSRCGYCEQSCPTYAATSREPLSPRGRNQLVRLALEGQAVDKASLREALSTCLLCGACSTVCYAHVPTADIVLEGRRMMDESPPAAARFLGSLAVHRPGLFAALLKIGYALKRLGLSRLARPALRILGLAALAEADASMDEAPLRFLRDILPRPNRTADSEGAAENPAWAYFAACGPNYAFPRVGLATWKVLERLRGSGKFLDNPCCGLLSYNYGRLSDARDAARINIARWEKALGADSDSLVVADCSSCAAFLKSYPRLFPGDAAWQARAEAFSNRVRDAVEVMNVEAPELAAAYSGPDPVVYHESCRACHGQGLAVPEKVLKRACDDRYHELAEAQVCCGGAGAFSFLHPELSDDILKRKIGNIARAGARVVLTSSTSCLIQLARGLRKYYPQARAAHLSEFLALSLAEKNGTTTRA